MGSKTQPTIAHGIARLHPEQELIAGHYEWGPDWTLPPNRSGRWAIDLIYDVAIRVEFDEAVPHDPDSVSGIYQSCLYVSHELQRARKALSAEDDKRRTEWLGYADKREAEAFVRQWTARKRREHGEVPTYERGAYIRDRYSSGVWHIAKGETRDHWSKDPNMMVVVVECEYLDVNLADEPDLWPVSTTEPGRVCKRCAKRVEDRLTPVVDVGPTSFADAARQGVQQALAPLMAEVEAHIAANE